MSTSGIHVYAFVDHQKYPINLSLGAQVSNFCADHLLHVFELFADQGIPTCQDHGFRRCDSDNPDPSLPTNDYGSWFDDSFLAEGIAARSGTAAHFRGFYEIGGKPREF